MGKGKFDHKKKRNSRTILIPVGVGIIIGLAASILAKDFLINYIYDDNLLIGLLKIYGLIFLIIILYLLQIIQHEAGHLIFGLLTGYSFVSFRVGSLTFIKEDGKWKRKKFNIPGTAGQCLMAPPECGDEDFPFQLYNYGGVLMNFITSLLAILFFVFISNISVVLQVMLVFYGGLGILLGLINAIPMKIGGIANDGLNISYMCKNKTARKAFYLQLNVNAMQSKGVRLKDMPLVWFKLSDEEDLTNTLIAFVKMMEYYRYLDRMDFDRAKETLSVFLPIESRLPKLYRYMIMAERAFFTLIPERNMDQAKRAFTREVLAIMKAARFDIGMKRIKYAYLCRYLSDGKGAEKCYQEAIGLSKVYPIRAEAESNLILIEYIKELNQKNRFTEV